uniref:Uncharacterized protein n=1 Tax=Cacopsylla melanoneura TaxID=428564 RepID=A0A8D8Y9M9_9HEMI
MQDFHLSFRLKVQHGDNLKQVTSDNFFLLQNDTMRHYGQVHDENYHRSKIVEVAFFLFKFHLDDGFPHVSCLDNVLSPLLDLPLAWITYSRPSLCFKRTFNVCTKRQRNLNP